MPWIAAAMVAVSALSQMKQQQAQKTQARAMQQWQEYQNQMAHIADAQNQNSITTNTTLAIQASANEAVQNQAAGIQAEGAAKVAAAAAGVKGGSVAATIFNVERGIASVEYQRQQDLQNKFLAFDTQRRQSVLSAKMQEDHSYIPKPSSAAMLLGIAKSGLEAYSMTRAPSSGGYGGSSGYSDAGTWNGNKVVTYNQQFGPYK